MELIGLSRATLANIWQNISLALGLKPQGHTPHDHALWSDDALDGNPC